MLNIQINVLSDPAARRQLESMPDVRVTDTVIGDEPEELSRQIPPEIISETEVFFGSFPPLNHDVICELGSRFSAVITCEEHTVLGGLGGAVAEVLMEAGVSTTFRRFGLPSAFPTAVGSQDHLRSANGVDAAALCTLVLSTTPHQSDVGATPI